MEKFDNTYYLSGIVFKKTKKVLEEDDHQYSMNIENEEESMEVEEIKDVKEKKIVYYKIVILRKGKLYESKK